MKEDNRQLTLGITGHAYDDATNCFADDTRPPLQDRLPTAIQFDKDLRMAMLQTKFSSSMQALMHSEKQLLMSLMLK